MRSVDREQIDLAVAPTEIERGVPETDSDRLGLASSGRSSMPGIASAAVSKMDIIFTLTMFNFISTNRKIETCRYNTLYLYNILIL